jgi:diguanylate cyclase (GGDEF)-like protein
VKAAPDGDNLPDSKGEPTGSPSFHASPGTPNPPGIQGKRRRFAPTRSRSTVAALAACALGTLAGASIGHIADTENHREFLLEVRKSATVVRLDIAEAERWLFSALVADPISFGETAAAAENRLRAAKRDLAAYMRYARLKATLPQQTELQASFERFSTDSGHLLASLRAGNFAEAVRIGTAVGGEVGRTTGGPASQIATKVDELNHRIDQAERPGRSATLAGSLLGPVLVGAAQLLRRRRRRRMSATHLASLAQHIAVIEPAVVVLDRLGRIELVTKHAAQLLQVPASVRHVPLVSAAGDSWAILAASTGLDGPVTVLNSRGGVTTEIEASNPVHADDGQSLLWVLRDVTAERTHHGELTHKAFHDPLTGLPNREHFRQVLLETLADVAPEEIAVLFVDLDGFKPINDSFGHAVGDRLLTDVAGRLREIVRGDDIIGRLGGDEFALVLRSTRPKYAEVVAEQIVSELAEPFLIDGRSMRIGASVGYTHATIVSTVEDLLREADVAMYRAKSTGKGRAARFDPEMLAATRERMEFERELQFVASSGQLRLLYQPVVELATGRMVGMEALIRWQHPERGLVSPTEFIAAAEANGSIIEIGRWVLRTALVEFQRIPTSYALHLNINVSPRQLCEPDFVEVVADELARAGVDASTVTLEVTESLSLGDVDEGIARLHELKALGVRLALDDFGTGYSSLSYLSRLPVDNVKIDQSFVKALQEDDYERIRTVGPMGSSRTAFIAALIDLCHGRELSVVAEGVEEPFQVAILRELGCDFAQGFLFAHPLSAASLAAAVESSDIFEPTSPTKPTSLTSGERTEHVEPTDQHDLDSSSAWLQHDPPTADTTLILALGDSHAEAPHHS